MTPEGKMRSRNSAAKALLLAMALATGTAQAQTSEPQTIDDALHGLSQQAAVIFGGQVVAVRRIEGVNGAAGVVETDFAVEDSIRGISGATYMLRQWAGLWPGGVAPFRLGQRYLMFLHAPGPSGLSSPVGGMDGAIPILERAVRVVDLRWIGTRVVRPIAYRSESVVPRTASSVAIHPNAVTAPIEAAESAAGEFSSYAVTLATLRAREGSNHGKQ
jgi:hypothetical protein